jgi:hypothetical protein
MAETPDTDFSSNNIRLNAREWLVALGLFAFIILATPLLWRSSEHIETHPDYRVPYDLSNDYWVYDRHLRRLPAEAIAVVGDSVVWGEYVDRNGTVSHFLSEQTGRPFINAGVNGLYPLALEGLIKHHGAALQNRKVLLHCNLLWLSSPERDLQTPKEQTFNHPALIPQISPRIPSYHADTETRLVRTIENRVAFFTWVNHLQESHFDQKSIPQWTIAEAKNNPDSHPNNYANPLAQIQMTVPPEKTNDPIRGTASPRHKRWSGTRRELDWVPLETSLQWRAFQRLVRLLKSRGNDVYVVVGPLNQHMLTGENRTRFKKLGSGVAIWLTKYEIPHFAPDPLPSVQYADASHPLTQGYQQLAKKILTEKSFTDWLGH